MEVQAQPEAEIHRPAQPGAGQTEQQAVQFRNQRLEQGQAEQPGEVAGKEHRPQPFRQGQGSFPQPESPKSAGEQGNGQSLQEIAWVSIKEKNTRQSYFPENT